MFKEFNDLRDIIWHDPIECIPWEQEGRRILSDSLPDEYKEWLLSVLRQEDINSLSFLDITLSNIDQTEFFGLLLAPDKGRANEYKDTVRKLIGWDKNSRTWVRESRTVGSHEVFQAGLPVFNKVFGKNRPRDQDRSPQTWEAMQNCLRDGLFVVSDRFLYWADQSSKDCVKEVPETEYVQAKSSIPLYAENVLQTDFGHPEDPAEYRKKVRCASEYPIQDNWEVYIKYLKAVKMKLTNARGEPLLLVLAIPLCLWIYSDHRTYVPVAQIFIGLGGARAKERAWTIARVVITHALRSSGAARAEFIGRSKARGNIAHRLPGTLDAMILALEEQKVEIPPLFYELKMISSLQQGLLPRWQRYEKLCRQKNRLVLTPAVIQKFWDEIANPIGSSRVQLDPEEKFQRYWDQAPAPQISVTGDEEVILKDESECSILFCLCSPLLIEAFQHALMWSIIEYNNTNKWQQAQVQVSLGKKQIVIQNPVHESSRLPNFTGDSNQEKDIEAIKRLANSVWTVEFPKNPQSLKHGDLWVVRIKKGERE
ncbi:MAG: hypothetical protein ACE5NG_05955 [bacterium]